jgi:tetratricopeptide (TPR) repeat protein
MQLQLAKINKYFQKINIIAALYFITVFLVIAAIRSKYPFELEILEGPIFEHVTRLLHGQNVYVPPSINFVPFNYTPLYYVFAAGLALVLGANFFTLRFLSIISALGIFIIIYQFVKKETGNKTAGIIAAGLFAATYKICNTWFDIARVDSLYNFWLILSIYILRFSRNKYRILFTSLVLSLAYFTKQSITLFLLPLALSIFWTERKNAIKLILYTAVIIITVSIFINNISDGWFNYYIWKLSLSNDIDYSLLLPFWTYGLLKPFGIAFLFICAFFLKDVIERKKGISNIFHIFIFLGLLGLSFAGTAYSGSNRNAMMPVYMGICIMLGISYDYLLMWGTKNEKMVFWIYALLFIQFCALIYPPDKQLPSQIDNQSGQHFLEMIKKIDGPVWIPFHGYLATLAGKPAYANLLAMHGFFYKMSKLYDSPRAALSQSVQEALDQKIFTAIILDAPLYEYPELNNALEKKYEYTGNLFRKQDGFVPLMNTIRPELLYLPKGRKSNPPFELQSRYSEIISPSDSVLNHNEEKIIKRILAVANDGSEYSQLINQGIQNALQNNLEAAKDFWTRALELNPERPEAYANLGVFLERAGDYDKALHYYKLAAKSLHQPWQDYADELKKKIKK